MLRKSSDRQGLNTGENTQINSPITGKKNVGDSSVGPTKKKGKKKNKDESGVGSGQVTSQKSNQKLKDINHTSPGPLRNSFKKKKSKHKLSGILNISSACLAVKNSQIHKLSYE